MTGNVGVGELIGPAGVQGCTTQSRPGNLGWQTGNLMTFYQCLWRPFLSTGKVLIISLLHCYSHLLTLLVPLDIFWGVLGIEAEAVLMLSKQSTTDHIPNLKQGFMQPKLASNSPCNKRWPWTPDLCFQCARMIDLCFLLVLNNPWSGKPKEPWLPTASWFTLQTVFTGYYLSLVCSNLLKWHI